MIESWLLEQVTLGNIATLLGLLASVGWHARRVVEVEQAVQAISAKVVEVRGELLGEMEALAARRDADLLHIATVYQRKDVQAESLASIDRQLSDIRETLREMRMTKQH